MCKGKDFPSGGCERDIQMLWGSMAETGEPGVLATVVASDGAGPGVIGRKLVYHGDGRLSGTVGGGQVEAQVVEAARQILHEGGCRLVRVEPGPANQDCGSTMDVFLESIQQGHPFWIIGAGHVGRALLELGQHLPLRFTVVDDGPDRLAGFPADLGGWPLAATPEELVGKLEVVPGAAVLIASRSHEMDMAYLKAVLAAEEAAGRLFPFLGLLGSSRKIAQFRQQLAGNSRHLDRLDQAQMPVGLELGDGTPHGIALSILAEVLAIINHQEYLLDESGQALGIRLHRRRDA